MAQIFPRWTNSIPVWLTVITGFAVPIGTFVIYFWMSPKHTDVGYMPAQPIEYSHELHAGQMEMDCRYCHYNVERSAHAGVPPTQVCMNCHATVRKDSPKLEWLRKSWASGDPVPWKRIHKIPDYAYFNHSAHVGVGVGENRAAIGCETCHGRIDWMPVVAQQQPLSMSWCLDCHDDPTLFLRPVADVTKMGWQPSPEWRDVQPRIAKTLLPPGSRSRSRVDSVDAEGASGKVTYATAGCTGCHR